MDGADARAERLAWLAAGALAAAFLIAVVRCAWMSDDAYLTLRTLDNAVHGLGLRYNPAERVQAYTHPLWMLLLAVPYAVTHDAWRMPMAVGVGCTALAAGGLARAASGARGAAVAFAALVGSKAAVDYGTSGLENPLEALLLVAFVAVALRQTPVGADPGARSVRVDLGVLVGLAALLGTTRLDALVLVAPAVAAAFTRAGRDRWALALCLRSWALAAALAPLALWHAFALVYYGSALPNTAYAKLATDIPAGVLAARSVWSFAWVARTDPLTLPVIALGLGLALRRRDRMGIALAVGLVAHLLWVIRIGGDFMGGRMFVAPLWVAVALIGRTAWSTRWAVGLVALTAAALASPYAPLRSGPRYHKASPLHGVVDERGYYWDGTGLWARANAHGGPHHPFAADGTAARGTPVAVKSVVGLYGWAAGPEHHVVDRLGLADPFLARLPAERDPDWRIGHFRRRVPKGYVDAVVADRELTEADVDDPAARAMYADLRLATRAPLWTAARWGAIARLAWGAYPVRREVWVYGEAAWIPLDRGGSSDVDVTPKGAGVVVTGLDGAVVWDLDPRGAPWIVIVERGNRVIGGEVQVGTNAITRLWKFDRIVAFPARPAKVREVYHVPAPGPRAPATPPGAR